MNTSQEKLKVQLTPLQFDDYLDLKQVMIEAYKGGMENDIWSAKSIKKLLKSYRINLIN